MTDIQKEAFAFELYNQLQDEFGLVDNNGELATLIQTAKGDDLDKVIRSLQKQIVTQMKRLLI